MRLMYRSGSAFYFIGIAIKTWSFLFIEFYTITRYFSKIVASYNPVHLIVRTIWYLDSKMIWEVSVRKSIILFLFRLFVVGSEMVPRYAEHMNALNDIHGLIEAACNKIQLLETLAPDWENPETSNSDLDTRSEDGLNELATSLFDEASLQQFVIERRGQYFCSECSFQTNSYKMFCKHCAKLHPTVDSGVKNGQVPQVYRCIKCNYLALSFRGFKTHCIGKHRCFPHVVLQSVPLNCPKAEFYFQKFSETAESNQKKQALKLLNYFSAHKPHNFVAEKTEIIEENNESKEEVRCSICDYSTSLVYFLEKHYQTQHRRKGPSRNQTDSLFHCKDCTFTSISYKELHLHIFKIHTKNSTYFNFSQSTQCNNANNVTDYVIPESPAPSLGCYDNDTACILHCHLCSFSTSSISVMLNHWRSFHNRDYPLFVNQYINSNFSKNLIIVDIPVSMLDRSWTGGWVNEDLTGLLHKPLYHCSECSFSTVSLSTLNHHYSSAHPTVTYCSSKLDVSDAQPVDHVSNNGLFTHSTMRQCCYCDEFVTYFTKCMSEHHRTSHKIMKNDDNEDAGSRAVHRCVECGYCAEQEQMAQHYVSNHAINAITFTVESSADEFEAFCSFCSFSSTSLQDLSQHLLEHRTEHLTNYKHRHVTGYCCSICRRVFRQKHTLQYHYSRLHVDWNENCFEFKDFPPRFFTKNSALTSVAYKHETRSSSAGPLVATDQTSLDANMRQSPPSSQDNATDDARPTSSTIKSGYLCYLCNFSARNAKIVQDHLKDKHDVSMSISSVIRDTCRDAKRVVVSTCSHQFYALSKTDTYQKHVEALHNEKEPFACPHCFRKYICRVVLRMHVSKKHKHASTDDVSKKHRHASTDDVSNKHRLASTDDVSNKHRLASTDDVSKKHRLASTDDVKPKSSPRVLITNCSYRNSMRPVLYESHIAQKHNKESPYHCPRCVRVYVCRSMFLGHIRKKHRLQLTDQRVSRCRRPIPSYLRPATAVSLSSKPSATEIEANQSKDYQQPKVRGSRFLCFFAN